MIFTGKANSEDNKKELEILFYKNLLKDKKFNLVFNQASQLGTYKNIAQSNLTIGFHTTCLREPCI